MVYSNSLDDCGCCSGIDSETPVNYSNLPGQNTLSYRIGRHGQFKESMLAALAKAEYPALSLLGTREDDDFTIAYLDGVATVLDVLSFYQERYINENFLRTASERRSVLEMAQLIGYQLAPGVAAATHLAFTIQTTPGVPTKRLDPVTIQAGTRVQSVPGQDESPQVFETTTSIEARAEWNQVPLQTTTPYKPTDKDVDIFIEGTNNALDIGDAILIVGQHRMQNNGSERWDVRIIKEVVLDNDNNCTQLIWADPLGSKSPAMSPSETDVQIFVFRKRASLFGHNAVDTMLLNPELNLSENWGESFSIQNGQIDLANPEDSIVANSWIALVSNEAGIGSPDLPGYVELYRVKSVQALSRNDFAISGRTTRIEPDTEENLDRFDLRETLVLANSEALTIRPRPVYDPVFGDTLKLHQRVDGLIPEQYCAVSGVLQRLKVAPGVNSLVLNMSNGNRVLEEGDSLQLISPPEKLTGNTLTQLEPDVFGNKINEANNHLLQLRMRDKDGSEGTVKCKGKDWRWDSRKDDEPVTEIVQLNSGEKAIENIRERTIISLATALKYIYQRDTVAINFNVAPANNGETIIEILGDGDASKTDQTFELKQSPLTYTSADTPSGVQAAMEVRVNNLRWESKSSLYQADGDARQYSINNRDDGTVAINFGDGIEGARLPSGQTNVRAIYRKYVGSAANVHANKLSTLLQKPLGVQEVNNPEAATGGADPELIDDAKQNAPLTVLTLERAVSIADYQDYAQAFAGIAKAHALWIHSGSAMGIYITLAGIDGASIPSTSKTYKNLTDSLRRNGDAMLPLTMVNYTPATFSLKLSVKINSDASEEAVIKILEKTLRDYFSFKQREFGQHVSQDEILAVAHSVEYVDAVRITEFYKEEPGTAVKIESIIAAYTPIASVTASPKPAELLTLSSAPLIVETFL